MYQKKDYNEVLQDFREWSVMPVFTRFRSLNTFVDGIFSDGAVSSYELKQLERAEGDLLLEYQVAIDIWNNMPLNSPKRDAALFLVLHFYRCRNFLSAQRARAEVKNEDDKKKEELINTQYAKINEKYIDKSPVDKVLTVAVSAEAFNLIKQVETPEQRLAASIPEVEKAIAEMDSLVYESHKKELTDLIDKIHSGELENQTAVQIDKTLGLARFLQKDEERVRA